MLPVAAVLFLVVPGKPRILPAELSPGATGKVNILIIGSDARAIGPVVNEGRQRNPREAQSHSDVMMLMHLNLDQGRMSILGLPRDLLVEVPGVTRAESETDFTHMEKLTHVHAIGGEKLLKKTVERLLGIRIHRFIRFDFDTFRMTFWALKPLLGRLRAAGAAFSDPGEALQFSRRRLGLKDDDIDRTRNNLVLVKALVERLWWLGNTRLGDATVRRVLGIVGRDTDLTADEVEALVSGLRFAGFQPPGISLAVLPGQEADVTMERYGMTMSCHLPAYHEIGKQADRFLRDENVEALDFMTRQHFHGPAYLYQDYVRLAPEESLLDTTSLRTRLLEMQQLGISAEESAERTKDKARGKAERTKD
ncbi:MAG: LCP family protein [candidate division WOR-3 bacterium]|nr:MAG: LCP family protein [candidate division WOR-3 bacterium]